MLGRMKPWSYLVGPARRDHANVERPVISTACLRSGDFGRKVTATVTPMSASAVTPNAEALTEIRGHDREAA